MTDLNNFSESSRRKLGATGTTVLLADNQEWLLAEPIYRATARSLTHPSVDLPLDKIFEVLIQEGRASLIEIWEVARVLLNENYFLTDDELTQLLSMSPGDECQMLSSAVMQALFGKEYELKSYCHWIRASLYANGLGKEKIPTQDMPNVMAILVATNRTIPLSRFVDACRENRERENLEVLV